MTTPVRIGMIDRSGENTSVNFHLPAIASDGSNWPNLFAPTTGRYDLLKLTLTPLTRLNLTRSVMNQVVETSVGSLPADAMAQRELAIRFTYVDDVSNNKYRFDVPGPVDAVIQSGTDVIDLANVLIAAFKVDFEAQCVSPEGNAVTIIGARLVGRKS